MIKRIAFTMYPVRDMAQARRFYEQDLGLTPGDDFEGRWVEYDLAGGCFAITSALPHLSPSADSGGSIAFEVDDLDATLAALKARGVKVKVEAVSTPVCRLAVVLDPEGNAVTLHQLKG